MAGDLSITTKDLRRLVDLTDPSQVDEPCAAFPLTVLTGLRDLLGCDGVSYESHDVAGRKMFHRQSTTTAIGTGDFGEGAVQEAFWRLYSRGMCDYWPRTGDYASARRMLAEQDWPLWEKSAYGEWLRSINVRGEITVAFPADGGMQHRLLLWRFGGRDFTERDCLLLTLIQPRLALLHTAIRHRETSGVDLTPRQWEVMRLVGAGHTNRQIASRLAISEGTVRSHCENIFTKLEVTNRLAAVAKAFPEGMTHIQEVRLR